MSDDERFALILCGVIACVGMLRWLFYYTRSPGLGWSWLMRVGFLAVPLACFAGMVVLLKLYSAHDVRDSFTYMSFYSIMGVAWLNVVLWPAALIGLDIRGDIIERRNPAAAWAVAGLLVGLTLGFTGGNIGDGPGWWVVVFCAIVQTTVLYLLWVCAEPITRFTESITVERDTACGLRFGALLVASGLVLGRAVAGDWESARATLNDFSQEAWGVCLIWLFAVLVEFILRPTAERAPGNVVLAGLLPGLVYLGGAAGWLMHVGWW